MRWVAAIMTVYWAYQGDLLWTVVGLISTAVLFVAEDE